jgi:hypothetical protein
LGVHPIKHRGELLKLLIRQLFHPSQQMVSGNPFRNRNVSLRALLPALNSPASNASRALIAAC